MSQTNFQIKKNMEFEKKNKWIFCILIQMEEEDLEDEPENLPPSKKQKLSNSKSDKK